MFRHPSYYKKLRERNKSDQTISHANSTRGPSDVRSGPGLKQQAIEETVHIMILKRHKLQAASNKLQAPSFSSHKPQASSVKHKGSSFKPQASSSWIMDPGKSFTDL